MCDVRCVYRFTLPEVYLYMKHFYIKIIMLPIISNSSDVNRTKLLFVVHRNYICCYCCYLIFQFIS